MDRARERLLMGCRLLALSLLILLGATALAAEETALLPAGSRVKLVSPAPISVSASKVGQHIEWRVAEDVLSGDLVVVRKGAIALATVSTIFTIGHEHRLSMQVESVELSAGGSVPLEIENTGYRILNFYTSATNDAVVAEGTEVTVLTAAPVKGATSTFPTRAALAAAQAQAAPASTVTLKDGTPVHLRLARSVSSADAQVGDRIALEVTAPVKSGDVLAIPQGSVAWATVTEVELGRSYGRPGRVNLTIDSVRLPNGDSIPLRGASEAKATDVRAQSRGPMLFSAVSGLMLAATQEGKDISVPKGAPVEAFVSRETQVHIRAGDASAAGKPTAGAAQPNITVQDTLVGVLTDLVITSIPDTAEIMIDDKFVGSTPSRLLLRTGDHKIVVTKRGFRPWTRTLSASGGAIQLTAELTRATAGRK